MLPQEIQLQQFGPEIASELFNKLISPLQKIWSTPFVTQKNSIISFYMIPHMDLIYLVDWPPQQYIDTNLKRKEITVKSKKKMEKSAKQRKKMKELKKALTY